MIVKVNPGHLMKVFSDFITGNKKVMFNFETDGRTLSVQMLGDYTATCDMPVESVDGDYIKTDISVWVGRFIHVMSKDEMVQFNINDAVLNVTQSTFNCTLLREYEGRRELPDISGIELSNAYAKRLKFLAHMCVSTSCMAKELSIANPDPVFAGKRFYLNYNQSAYVDKMDYPEVCLPESSMRDFVFKLDDRAKYAYLKLYDMMYFHAINYDFWVPTVNYNINGTVIQKLDQKLDGSKLITKIKLADYKDKLNIMSAAFPKQKLGFAVGEGAFTVLANGTTTNVFVGMPIVETLATTMITSAQLQAIVKIFGEDEEVEVRKGVGCLCLACGEKALLIAEAHS